MTPTLSKLTQLAMVFALSTAHAPEVSGQLASSVPVRPLGPITATVKDSISYVFGLHQLSDGRLVVNEPGRRRILIFDSALVRATIVMDTSSTTARSYPTREPALFAFVGDSTLVADPVALAFIILDPAGRVARIISPPRAGVVGRLVSGIPAAIDPRGRLVYQMALQAIASSATPASGASLAPMLPDSAPLVHADLSTHQIDTIAFIRTAKSYPDVVSVDSEGRSRNTPKVNPLPIADGWALLPDGTIAIVRARDFHVDWVDPKGTYSASPKLPHEWHRLSDSDKAALIDSLRESYLVHPLGITSESGPDGKVRSRPIIPLLPDPTELPDYPAPFPAGAGRADADGNLWIREVASSATTNGPIYDLVNRSGEIFDRVQLPGGTSIEGFGPGVVYLSSRVGAGISLVRARIR